MQRVVQLLQDPMPKGYLYVEESTDQEPFGKHCCMPTGTSSVTTDSLTIHNSQPAQTFLLSSPAAAAQSSDFTIFSIANQTIHPANARALRHRVPQLSFSVTFSPRSPYKSPTSSPGHFLGLDVHERRREGGRGARGCGCGCDVSVSTHAGGDSVFGGIVAVAVDDSIERL